MLLAEVLTAAFFLLLQPVPVPEEEAPQVPLAPAPIEPLPLLPKWDAEAIGTTWWL